MTSQARVNAGKKAKRDGHRKETALSCLLEKRTGNIHTTDGGNKTKRDILCEQLGRYYSQKSPSGKNTQVHLTPTRIWCEYFNIDGDLRTWFDKFFGLPRSGREGRLPSSQISQSLNQLALDWFNNNKMDVFDVIVRRGVYEIDGEVKAGDAVNQVVWYNKKTDEIEIEVSVEYLSDLVKEGRWTLNETTLHFHDVNGNKLFHLQMKGSGGLSQKNSLQFHIYKPC